MSRIVLPIVLLCVACGPDKSTPVDLRSEEVTDTAQVAVPFELDDAQWDQPSSDYRPWVRWWWPGNDVEAAELKREVEVLVAAGFGGAEIQAMNAALDPEAPADELAQRLSVGSDSYWQNVTAALDAAEIAGLQLDLTLGSGWPTGGPHVSPAKSMQTLVWGEAPIGGQGQLTLEIPPPEMPAFYEVADMAAGFGEQMARYLVDDANLVAVVAARVTGGERDPNPLILDDVLTLDAASVVDLTDAVSAGHVSFDSPGGSWRLVAFYSMPDGQYPSLPATPEPGYVMDYLDAGVVQANLDHWLPATVAPHPALRGFFTDSFELKTERWFTGDFLAEFEARRGYSIVPFLPAAMLPGADNHIFDGAGLRRRAPFSFGDGVDARIQHDYQRTVSDLFLDRFLATANSRAEVSRVQAYGLGVDAVSAAAQANIPEAEQLFGGGTELFLKHISSGAHLGDRNVVSAESLVWADRAHMTVPAKLRAAADKLFAAGINHLVYHGFPYVKTVGYGESGWHAFCSPFSGLGTFASNIAESSPFWPRLAQLNAYVARMQYLLRQGEPHRGALVYTPFIGISASLMRMEEHDELFFNGHYPGEPGGAGANPLLALVDTVFGEKEPPAGAQWLEALARDGSLHGLGSWDFVNDDALRGLDVGDDGRLLLANGQSYDSLHLINVPMISADVAEAVAATAELAPGRVVVVGPPPTRQPGYFDMDAGDARVKAAMTRVTKASGELVLPVPLVADPLRYHRRDVGAEEWLAIVFNPTEDDAELPAATASGCASAVWLDVWENRWWPADGVTTVPALSSLVLLCGLEAPASAVAVAPPSDLEWAELDDFTLTVTGNDVVEEEFAQSLSSPLPDWRDLEALRYASSPGVYRAELTKAAPESDQRIWIEADQVWGTAEVLVNGVSAGFLMVPPFRLDVTESLVDGTNTFELRYTPTLRNRFVGYAQADDPAYPQFKTTPERLAPTGIVGSIRLVR